MRAKLDPAFSELFLTSSFLKWKLILWWILSHGLLEKVKGWYFLCHGDP